MPWSPVQLRAALGCQQQTLLLRTGVDLTRCHRKLLCIGGINGHGNGRRTVKRLRFQQYFRNQTASIESLANWGDADADRLARRLRKYQDRLTAFLHDPAVDGRTDMIFDEGRRSWVDAWL